MLEWSLKSKTLHFILLLAMALSIAWLLVGRAASGRATAAGITHSGITMLAPSMPVEGVIQKQTAETLAQDAAARGIFTYAITDAARHGDSLVVSVAGFAPGIETWTLDQALWLGAVTMLDGSGAGLVDAASTTTAPARTEGDRGGAGDILPFRDGTVAQYGVLGVHSCGFSLTGWKAVDLFPAENQVYAATSDEVSYVCRDGTQMSIRAGNHMYVHLVDNGIQIGDQLVQGQAISGLVPGTFTATCGNADQAADHAHIHFCFIPDDGQHYQTDGYTLDTLSNIWTKEPDLSVDVLGYLQADWADANVQPPASTVGGNFWDGIASGILQMATGVVPSLPVHETFGLADRVMSTAAAPLELVYAVVLSNFNMAISMWVAGIITILEGVRLVYAAWMWVKNAVPFAG